MIDTCASLYTGLKPFHQWIVTQVLFAIAEYVEYGQGTPYNSITFYTAIENDSGAPSHDGDLTVVIIYHTTCTTLSYDVFCGSQISIVTNICHQM